MSSLRQRLASFKATPRIYLFFPAIVIKLVASAVSAVGFVEESGLYYLIGMLLWFVWCGLLWLIALPRTDDCLRRFQKPLRTTALVLMAVLAVFGLLELSGAFTTGLDDIGVDVFGPNSRELLGALNHSFAYNDATALCHQAVDNMLDGLNPYAAANIVLASQRFGNPFDKTTPLRVGRFADDFPYPSMAEMDAVWDEALQNPDHIPPEIESRLAYPAACFLLPLPFLALGVGDLRLVYLLLLLAALAVVVAKAPGQLRWWLLGGIVVSLEVWNSIASGETGILFVPFLLLAWVLVRRKLWLAALCLGLATATKQVAWFFAPFFLVLVLRNEGFRRAALAAALAGAVFLALNLPFIIQEPGLWLSSVLAPMGSNIFPLGVGLVSLVAGGYWHMDNPALFTAMEALVGLAGLVWYYFNCRRAPHSGLAMAALPLLFAWRSLWSYFFYFDLIMFAAIILNEYGAMKSEEAAAVSLTARG